MQCDITFYYVSNFVGLVYPFFKQPQQQLLQLWQVRIASRNSELPLTFWQGRPEHERFLAAFQRTRRVHKVTSGVWGVEPIMTRVRRTWGCDRDITLVIYQTSVTACRGVEGWGEGRMRDELQMISWQHDLMKSSICSNHISSCVYSDSSISLRLVAHCSWDLRRSIV